MKTIHLARRAAAGRTAAHPTIMRDYPLQGFWLRPNRLFGEFLSDLPAAPILGGARLGTLAFSPRVDLAETDKEIHVSAELPGMEEKDIKVEVDETAITISGERKEEKEETGKNWHTREQSYGSFQRVVALPALVDGEKAVARFRKGVLTVTVPKNAQTQSKRKVVKIQKA